MFPSLISANILIPVHLKYLSDSPNYALIANPAIQNATIMKLNIKVNVKGTLISCTSLASLHLQHPQGQLH
jgi:hypothetical protein